MWLHDPDVLFPSIHWKGFFRLTLDDLIWEVGEEVLGIPAPDCPVDLRLADEEEEEEDLEEDLGDEEEEEESGNKINVLRLLKAMDD